MMLAGLLWGIFFLAVYGGALWRGWYPSSLAEVLLGILLVVGPWAVFFLARFKRDRRQQGG